MWIMDAEIELRRKINIAYKKMLDLAEEEQNNEGVLKCIEIIEDTFSIEKIGEYANEKKEFNKGPID